MNSPDLVCAICASYIAFAEVRDAAVGQTLVTLPDVLDAVRKGHGLYSHAGERLGVIAVTKVQGTLVCLQHSTVVVTAFGRARG